MATIGNHFGYSTADGAVSLIYDSKEMNSFLDDRNCGVLCARVELTHDVKIVQVSSDSLPEMELQGAQALVGGAPSPSRPHHHGQPALQHPGVHHGGNAAGEPLSHRVEGARAHLAQGQQVEQGAL